MYIYIYDKVLSSKSKRKIANTGSILNIQKMTQTYLLNIFLVIDNICIFIDINLPKTVANDLLQCHKIEKMVFIEIDRSQSIFEWYSKLESVKRASVKRLFTNHLRLRIFSLTNLQIWKK